jgi:hypothetical protein
MASAAAFLRHGDAADARLWPNPAAAFAAAVGVVWRFDSRADRGTRGTPTEETDGIALALGNFGPAFPGGLFIAQDGVNAPAAQNFKLVAWRDALRALARPRGGRLQ